MKKIIVFLLVLIAQSTWAQKAPYNVVFDVTSSDTIVHQMVMRWVKEIAKADPSANIEVVYYAKSLGMVTKGSVVGADVVKYAAFENVKFNVCEGAMKNNKIEKDQLLEGVGTVPDGIFEIIQKQHEGWGYIKASR